MGPWRESEQRLIPINLRRSRCRETSGGMPSWEVALGCAGKRKKVDRAYIELSSPGSLT